MLRNSSSHSFSEVGERATRKGSVLVVDDDVSLCSALARLIERAGYEVTKAFGAPPAIDAFQQRAFDVVLSDLVMPKMTGVEFLSTLRVCDQDVPFILMTGNPTLNSAVDAVSLGAVQYLTKPSSDEVIVAAIERACRRRRWIRPGREGMDKRAALEDAFNRAVSSMRMDFQPIVHSANGRLFAYEALMRVKEPTMSNPTAVLDAAESLDCVHDLGRRVRALSAEAFRAAAHDVLLFVNLHPEDLLDPDLYDESSPLGAIASRVVLEITERAAIHDAKSMKPRIEKLRKTGYKIAIDDLGAGYSGLSTFVALEPEIVKLDMSLVRNVHKSAVQERVMRSVTSMCRDMGIAVVAEGIEIEEERRVACQVGCNLLQGYFFAKPGPIPSQ